MDSDPTTETRQAAYRRPEADELHSSSEVDSDDFGPEEWLAAILSTVRRDDGPMPS
jgi:hypothetical protein